MRLGRYEVLSELGRGGMGVVYRARSDDGREVALKVLARTEPAHLARFEREQRLLSSFQEADGFVPLLDSGSAGGTPYVVMPLVPGGTLRGRLAERGRLTADETAALGRGLGAALGRAHERGVVHRDVKPENILFASDGRPLLADLGLAKHFDRGASGASASVSLSRTGEGRGTAGYMPPEQISDATHVGPAADVFALGAVLYECLAGFPAFAGENAVEVAAKIASGEYPALRRPDAPAWLTRAIERALDPEPRGRFAHGAAFARALSEPGAAKARRGPALALVAALALAAAGAIPFVLASRERAETARVAAEKERAARELATLAGSDRIEDLDQAIARDPKLARAWRRRGTLRFVAGDTARALEDLTRAIQLDPQDAAAYALRGHLLVLKGEDPERARADFDRAIALDPAPAAPWAYRAHLEMGSGDLAAAIADYGCALERDPTLAEAWRNRGLARGDTGDVRGAVEDFTRAIELDPKDSSAWSNRAHFHRALKEYAAAIDDLAHAVELEPSNSVFWENRATIRGDAGDRDGSIADATRAIELEPRDGQYFLTRGTAYDEKGEIPRALADYDEALRLGLDDGSARRLRSRIAQLRARGR